MTRYLWRDWTQMAMASLPKSRPPNKQMFFLLCTSSRDFGTFFFSDCPAPAQHQVQTSHCPRQAHWSTETPAIASPRLCSNLRPSKERQCAQLDSNNIPFCKSGRHSGLGNVGFLWLQVTGSHAFTLGNKFVNERVDVLWLGSELHGLSVRSEKCETDLFSRAVQKLTGMWSLFNTIMFFGQLH